MFAQGTLGRVTPDIRLIAVDMDGTLLDADHRPHPTLWPLLDELDRRGIAWCPASGRQYWRLSEQFADAPGTPVYIAENGAHVVHGGRQVSADVLDREVVGDVVRAVRGLAASGQDVGAVVCGTRSAYVERADGAFRAQADTYYARLAVVPDLLEVQDEVVKVAVFDFGSAAATTEPGLARFRPEHQVVVSGEHWTDVMNASTHKGAALARVQESLGVTAAQTMAFGDYLNDLELLAAAEHSYAMANAHPEVLRVARHRAPSNAENGVVRTIAAALGIAMADLEDAVRASA